MGKRKRSQGSPDKDNAGKSSGSRNPNADDHQGAQQTVSPKGVGRDKKDTRNSLAISAHVRRNYRSTWNEADDTKLAQLVHKHGDDWATIASCYEERTIHQVQHRWLKVLDPSVRKGPWTEEEDAMLRRIVKSLGQANWNTVAESLPGRLGKQCRERWVNHLDPSVKKGDWTAEEDACIARLYRAHGSQWKSMTAELPGRTDNAIKNRFHSTVKKNVNALLEGRYRHPGKAGASPDRDWLGHADVVEEVDIRRSKRQRRAPKTMEGMEILTASPDPASEPESESESDSDELRPSGKWKPGAVRFVSKSALSTKEKDEPAPTIAAIGLPAEPFVMINSGQGGNADAIKRKTRRVGWAQTEITGRRVRRSHALHDEEKNSEEDSPPIISVPAHDSLLIKRTAGLRGTPLPLSSHQTLHQTFQNGQEMRAEGSNPNGSVMPDRGGKIPSWVVRANMAPELTPGPGMPILPQPDSTLATALACQVIGRRLSDGGEIDDIAKALGWDWMPSPNDANNAENSPHPKNAVAAFFKANPRPSPARPPLQELDAFNNAGHQTVGIAVAKCTKNASKTSGVEDSPDNIEWAFWPQNGARPAPCELGVGLSPLGWAPDTSAREGPNPFYFSPLKTGTKRMRLDSLS